MTRRRDSYRGGSTIHIPARDSPGSDEGPVEALARAREKAVQGQLDSVRAAQEAPALFQAFCVDLDAAYDQVKRRSETEGASLPRLDALDWRKRLSQITQLFQLAGNDSMAKAAQNLMGHLADAHRDLSHDKRYPEEGHYDDFISWTPAVYPHLYPRLKIG